MAIAVDKLTIGSSAIDSASSTISFTTTQAVASGGFIVLCVGWFSFSVPTITSVTGGSLTWTVDKQGGDGSGANCAIVSAQAPSGLPLGTTITATLSASAPGGRSIAGTSFTGVATSSPVDGTPPLIKSFASTAWATNAATLTAGSLLVGTAHQISSNFTSTPTSPATEMFDINGGAGSFSATGAYRIEASAGSYTVAGTWSSSATGVANAVAYKAATGGGTDLTETPGTPNVAWAGTTPGLLVDISRTPGAPNVDWTGSTPALKGDSTLTPGAPTVAWTGSTPTISTSGNTTLTPGAANVDWIGSTAPAEIDVSRTPGTPVVAWSGSTAPTKADVTLKPGTPNVSWQGSTPSLVLSGEVTVTPGAATVAWSGSTPTLRIIPDFVPPPEQAGGGILTSEDEDLTTHEVRNLTLRPGVAEVTWTGSRPRLLIENVPLPLRFRLPLPRRAPAPEAPKPLPVVDLALHPRSAVSAWDGSTPRLRIDVPVEQLRRAQARIAQLETERDEDLALIAALSDD